MPTEVEVRSFVSEDEFNRLMAFFKQHAKYLGEDYQTTYYLSGKHDLRLQQNNKFSKIWMKSGRIHDKHRDELEVHFRREDFEKLVKIFEALGYSVEIKWFRTRHAFRWQGIDVMLDYTKGYGYIIELEKISDEKRETYSMLKSQLKSLGVKQTSRSEFEKQFRYYKKHWKRLVS